MKSDILIVDDSLTVRMDLNEAFETAGFATRLCASAGEAFQAIARQLPALIVLDVRLPDLDGIDLMRQLRGEPGTADIPVLLLSSEAEVKDRIRGIRTGADEFVGKPYDSGHVVSRARELIRRRDPGQAATAPENSAPVTLLIIDDSPSFCEAVAEQMRELGYRVLTAASGEEGLRIAASTRPDAVIVDGILPGIEGATVVRRIKLDAALRSTPCYLLTASDALDDELRALEAGADAYIRKDEHVVDVLILRIAALLRAGRPVATVEARPSLLSPKRILAVDDSATYLQALAAQLRQEDYDVILARSGEEALELLEVQTVDCILLDLIMPGLSGHETCRLFKASPRWRDIPLIMLTAREERESMIEGINAGADDYIAKSSDFEVLRARLRAQLRRKQFEDENRHIREELLRKGLEASEARASRGLAEARSAMLSDLERKNAELAEANHELERARELALQESAFKSRFLASMSHELRTPLNAIIGFSELLELDEYGPLTDTQKEFVHYVRTSGVHLLSLINDVLDLSRIEANRMDLHCERCAIQNAALPVVGVITPLALKKGITLRTSIPDDLPGIWIDVVRIKQVLYNLLSNAIKFTPRGGEVHLDVTIDSMVLYVRVRDTGIGIRPEHLNRLFREFERIEPEQGETQEGAGLGLALTRRLIEAHGGTISVQSIFGRGSTFTVELPLTARPDTAR